MGRNRRSVKDGWLAVMPRPTLAVFISLGILIVTASVIADSKAFPWRSLVDAAHLARNIEFLVVFIVGGFFGMLFSAVARSSLREGADLFRASALWSGLGLGLLGFSLLSLVVWASSAWVNVEDKRDFWGHLPQHDPGGLFAAFMGVVTILGFAFTLHDLREMRRKITTFPDLIGRFNKMVADLKTDEVVQFLAYTPALGYIALQDREFKEFENSILDVKAQVDMVCLSEKGLTEWHDLFIDRRTRRKRFDTTGRESVAGPQKPKKPGFVDQNLADNATEEGEYIVHRITDKFEHNKDGNHVSRLPFEFLPGYYFFVSPKRALVVAPLQLPFPKGAPSSEVTDNRSTVQMLGFETDDRAIIRDLSDLHESYKLLPSSYVAEDNRVIKGIDFPGWCQASSPMLQETLNRLLRQYKVASGGAPPEGKAEITLAEDYRTNLKEKLNDTNLEVTVRLTLTKKSLPSDYRSPRFAEKQSSPAAPEGVPATTDGSHS